MKKSVLFLFIYFYDIDLVRKRGYCFAELIANRKIFDRSE